MSHFPVTNSLLSAEHLALFVQDKYALSKNASCRLLKAGINDTYLITDVNEKFVFRVYNYNWRSLEEITDELELLVELKNNNIAVSYPIKDTKQNFIQTLIAPEGIRFGVLFSYAKGYKMHLVSPKSHFEIGQLMAGLHMVTQNKKVRRVTYSPEVILVESLKKLDPFLSETSQEMKFLLTAQNFLLKEYKNADASQMRNGVVHLDIWFDNLNVTDDNVVTIFDFDFCGNGWLAIDVAYYMMQLHNVEKYEAKDYQPKVDSFLKGYESISPLSKEEKRLLPVLGVSLYFFYLGIQCQRYESWSNSFLNENYLKRFINGLVKRYYNIYELGDNNVG